MFFDLFRYLYINACFHGLTFQIVFFLGGGGAESAADVLALSSSIDTLLLICLFLLYCNISHVKSNHCLENRCATQSIFQTFGFCNQHLIQRFPNWGTFPLFKGYLRLSLFVAKKTGLPGREDFFFGLHRFLVEKQDSVDVPTFFLVFTDFGGIRANP